MELREGKQVTLDSMPIEPDDDMAVRLAVADTEDGARIEGMLWQLKDQPRPRTAVVTMHPANNTMQNYLVRDIAREGYAALKLSTRYAGDDSTLVFEKVVLDVAAGIRWLREQGFEKVVLHGHSGGASMMALYQSQAHRPTITSTPAGDPPDLTRCDLPEADALIICNAHASRAKTLTNALDPSVLDESDPIGRDPELDMFDPRNGPPYDREWLAAYRAAQVARGHRITEWCRQRLRELEAIGDPVVQDLPFTVYRTVADPAYLDLTIEPNDRPPGTIWGDPAVLNYVAVANHWGPHTTLRSWLSQWALESSNCDLIEHIPYAGVPCYFLAGTADRDTETVRAAYEACTESDKQLEFLEGGTHLFKGQPEVRKEFVHLIANWMRAHGL